ncbi:hypothetical protein SDC9_54446 [bioreactor metagenome]|uniref:Prepilin type IV endopeptidase peptidase domain-containing protein n=1 Tax=bioreactor metagenome TaxID=1076179 RepID=A0A644X1U1_9ZZZZ
MERYLPILVNAAVLIYGGVIDFKRREIPDAVPALLLVTGCFFAFSPLGRILGLVAPAILLFAASKITRSAIPGGDFKLLCSLGFACGLPTLTVIIFLAGIGAVVYGVIKRLPVKRHIPLCTYIAPTYIALQVIVLVSSFC